MYVIKDEDGFIRKSSVYGNIEYTANIDYCRKFKSEMKACKFANKNNLDGPRIIDYEEIGDGPKILIE